MAAEAATNVPVQGHQFPGQLPNEEVYLLERRYWFVLLQWIRVPVSLTLLLGLLVSILTSLVQETHRPLPVWGSAFLWALFLSPGCGWTIWRVLDWGNDWFIVTDRRVVHIDDIPFIRRRRDEAPLEMIQDVSVHMRGLEQNLLYFGITGFPQFSL